MTQMDADEGREVGVSAFDAGRQMKEAFYDERAFHCDQVLRFRK